MNTHSCSGLAKLLLLSLIFFVYSIEVFSFQKNLTLNENIYKKVVSGGQAGTDFVIVDNLSDFDKYHPGDTVLLIQMKGLSSTVSESPFYGFAQDTVGCPGCYEFLLIESVSISERKIIFKNNITQSFSTRGNLQIIRVPSYSSAIISAEIACPPWDSLSGKGGVLSMFVENTLMLNADINVSGKGFVGGAVSPGDGICCDFDPVNFNKYSYPSGYTNSGFKGESMVNSAWIDPFTSYPIYPGYAKGLGANFNGGGGGNGRFSGGGGGSNYGAGGRGGRESTDQCTVNYNGGLGGRQIKMTPLSNGIFPGGGGGGSTAGGGTGSDGGRGGGIVIIVCRDIKGNGYSIKADGEHPPVTASGLAGAGGGGGGGSIVLCLEDFSTTTDLTLSAKGGQGGNTGGTFGEGGGGGGGLIWLNNITVPSNIITNITGGSAGTRVGAPSATSGATGESLTTLVPALNGFLFNSLSTDGDLPLYDTVYNNQVPGKITGSIPVGGSGPYTYLWQRKNKGGTTWSNIPSSNTRDLVFTEPETNTFYARRIVRDESTILTDTSKQVTVEVLLPTILTEEVKDNALILYPNPSSNLINLHLDGMNNGKMDILIYNNLGLKMASYTINKEGESFDFIIHVDTLPAGLYFFQIRQLHKLNWSGRFVVTK